MIHYKLQLGCMLVLMYIAFINYEEYRRYKKRHRWGAYDILLGIGVFTVLFDGITACMVNNLNTVSPMLNRVCHALFLLGIDTFIFAFFLYMLYITTGFLKNEKMHILIYLPFLINVVLVLVNMPNLEYLKGTVSNYSMGVSAYTCFITEGVYTLLTLIIFLSRWKYIERHKRISILTYLVVVVCITIYQMINPEVLLSSICITITLLGIYINQENPSVERLSTYHRDMVMGFATLLENKDGSTGGHIKRTSTYVELLTDELRRRGLYKDILTKDYLNNLYRAAPMHDIGKVAVPDVILQKPGKLTAEEYEVMKLHTVRGGEIVCETFGNLDNQEYTQMAYEVTRFHHERWNGKGYPEGLKEADIPLCARIMAIADVFDAVSMKRCYRDAMPLDKCFEIILEGRGIDFEPVLVDIFLESREKVEKAYNYISALENQM